MAKNAPVSTTVIKRLARYYRFLEEIKKSGISRISSGELSRRMGLTASQIRQDLNRFGGFGQQGYGYNTEQLYNELSRILGVKYKLKTVLIGAGNLGRAVATHMSFEARGFKLIGIFDKNETLTGQIIRNLPIRSIDELFDFCRDNSPAAALLCIPSESARELVEELVKLGIRGFWNFSHYDIAAEYPNVAVENVHLSDSLMTLRYRIKNL